MPPSSREHRNAEHRAPVDGDGRTDRMVLFAMMACPFLVFLRPSALWLLMTPAMVAGLFYLGARPSGLRGIATFWVIFFAALVLQVPWPLSFVLPLVVFFVLARFWGEARQATGWLRAGVIDRGTLALMIPIILISSGALIAWFVFLDPDVSDILATLPKADPVPFFAVAFVFSVLNAAWEELLLKGVMWEGLSRIFRRGLWINLVQSVFFGLIHYHGFPRGALGVVMAAVYGLLIGFIREQSKGMLAPIVTHTFADITICALLYFRLMAG